MTDFFLQQVPQSEYRRIREKKDGDTTYLDIHLNPINIKDPALIQELIARIEGQADLIYSILLPDREWNPEFKSKLLSQIFSSLGIPHDHD
ncbi:hypothetical protein EBR96_05555 [bacterium]|nr:hypothetical protein [bacterium]